MFTRSTRSKREATRSCEICKGGDFIWQGYLKGLPQKPSTRQFRGILVGISWALTSLVEGPVSWTATRKIPVLSCLLVVAALVLTHNHHRCRVNLQQEHHGWILDQYSTIHLKYHTIFKVNKVLRAVYYTLISPVTPVCPATWCMYGLYS